MGSGIHQPNAASNALGPGATGTTPASATDNSTLIPTTAWVNEFLATRINVAATIRATVGVPIVLGTDQNGDFAIDTSAKVIYGPMAGGAWPSGTYYGGNDNGAADYGYAGLTLPMGIANGFEGNGGIVYLARFTAVSNVAASNIDYNVLVAGSGMTANECFLAIYDTGQATAGELTQLGISSDQSTNVGTAGTRTAVLTSSVNLAAGDDYFVATLFNGSTPPTLLAQNSQTNGLPFNNPAASNRMAWQAGSIGGPNTTLPATISDVGFGPCSLVLMAGIRV